MKETLRRKINFTKGKKQKKMVMNLQVCWQKGLLQWTQASRRYKMRPKAYK